MIVNEIKEDFKKVIQYSQNIEDPKIDELFEQWLDNKRDIIEAFGGKYICEYPEKVCFELGEAEKLERFKAFLNYVWELGFVELFDFLEQEKEGFFKNVVIEDYVYEPKKTKITKNTKLIKAFKYFIDDSDDLNAVQSRASQIIQENKIEGVLCFSVHPLDYLSVSENTHNWRSCHALDGEYRAGNLSYMTDQSTIVCYLRSKEMVNLPNFPSDVLWNNKKWRVLFYLSNNWKMIFAGKQYPFSTSTGMEFIINNCFNSNNNKVIQTNRNDDPRWSNWTDYSIRNITNNDINYEFNDNYIPLERELIKLNELVVDADGSKQFNDVLRSSCYTPMYTQLTNKSYWFRDRYCDVPKSTRFKIGSKTTCLCCGKEEVLDCSETMRCFECEFKYGTTSNDVFGYCEHCGRRVVVDDAYWLNDDLYCDTCYEDRSAVCSNCGDRFLIKDLYYAKDDKYICHYCKD